MSGGTDASSLRYINTNLGNIIMCITFGIYVFPFNTLHNIFVSVQLQLYFGTKCLHNLFPAIYLFAPKN